MLLTLAAVQFTHIVDFMIMMPLGPQLMRILEIGPRQFSLLVSAYTFAAAASGFVAAFWIDRFDHKRVLLALYGGFIVATALCGLAPNYPLLLAARIVAGTFGGVIGGLVLAIVADLVPFARRATATGIVATSFSLAAVAGVPAGLWIAAHSTWRTPFLVLAAASVVVAIAASRVLPPISGHLAHAVRRRPVEQLRAIFGEPNHLRTFAFTVVLMFAGSPSFRSSRRTTSPMSASRRSTFRSCISPADLPRSSRSPIIGRLADRYGKKRVFGIVGVLSIVPILITTHLEPVSLSIVVACAVLFFVLVTGRFGPGMALISGKRRAAAARLVHELQCVDPAVGGGSRGADRRPRHRPGAGRHADALRRRRLDRRRVHGAGDLAREPHPDRRRRPRAAAPSRKRRAADVAPPGANG